MIKVVFNILMITICCLSLLGCGKEAKNDTPEDWIKNNHSIFVVSMSNEIIMNGMTSNWELWQRIGGLPNGLKVIKPSVSKMIAKIEDDKQNNVETIIIQKRMIKLLKDQEKRVSMLYKGKNSRGKESLMNTVVGSDIISKNINFEDLLKEGIECAEKTAVRERHMRTITNEN